MQTLKDLKKRGVKVELGIPDDLWDAPSAEITNLKKHVIYLHKIKSILDMRGVPLSFLRLKFEIKYFQGKYELKMLLVF